MAKVTSKYQVTLPRAIAQRFSIRPGDEIDWTPAGDSIRVTPASVKQVPDDRQSRLRLFDAASERERRRKATPAGQARNRGWTREDLYRRGRTR